MHKKTIETLTDIEIRGLSSHYSLADGHAYQDIDECYKAIINSLPDCWGEACTRPIPELEFSFKQAYATLAGSPALTGITQFKICPTASNSIDIVGAFLAELNIKTALIEPTFDNLALLLKRRSVELVSIYDDLLVDAARHDGLGPDVLDENVRALFLVNPNNPTGRVLSEAEFRAIVNYCAHTGTKVILDNSFRLHNRRPFDDYRLLEESGVSFVCIEDTGKVFPTLDMKGSLLVYSEDNQPLMDRIYNEIFLCTSAFSLVVLEKFLTVTAQVGLHKTVWRTVDTHRQLLRAALDLSILEVDLSARQSSLSVEWLDCSLAGLDDFRVCSQFEQQGITVLPGRMFYWNSHHVPAHQRNLRISLLKPHAKFADAVDRLSMSVGRKLVLPLGVPVTLGS
jgi:aspartate/methionine/tyrosine aminotransferase